jgi:hypothetical protein
LTSYAILFKARVNLPGKFTGKFAPQLNLPAGLHLHIIGLHFLQAQNCGRFKPAGIQTREFRHPQGTATL